MKHAWSPGAVPAFLFHQGTNYRSYELLGCHVNSVAAIFRVWAPNSEAVSVVGDWNNWDNSVDTMTKVSEQGIWETAIEGVAPGQRYKYSIKTKDGRTIVKSDPFAFYSETDGKTASVIYNIEGYDWRDTEWIGSKADKNVYESPMNIYEMHVGSWRWTADRQPMGYRETADLLVPYLTEMGFNYLELLPVMEHPYGKSWGYQLSGYFAASSRWGEPKDLMYLIDKCHQAGIGVLLDWVPSHFPKDEAGLVEFDGGDLYEAHGWDKKEQPQWGTRCFDYGRTEVQSFLVSSAIFWLDLFHADGLRVDAVSSMVYLSYGREPGEWFPNQYGDNKNLDGIAFLKKLNKTVFEYYPTAIMAAEESSAYPMVTKPIHEGGLGFNFKWNMGWMNDMLSYTATDPLYRKDKHDKVTFSFHYAFSENYILPISHDEVVHGKASLLNKMPGNYETKFAGLRAFLGYMFAHPGKKLNFMGTEFGQFIEWNEEDSLDWHLLEYPYHRKIFDYVKALNHFYLETPALWEIDYSWDGFRWISADDRSQNIIIFIRIDKSGNKLIIAQNFAPVKRENYRFGVPDSGVYAEAFNSDLEEYGGGGVCNPLAIESEAIPLHGFDQSVSVTLPPLSTLILRQSDAER
ncbi:MAG: 1,4-alpha-glucan branching protein GlgB [Oscillospiraceae bacterium]|jgi:1,4-alpha-glucan branching enzyme|nr:1,4-alpha-glucan branching protein GlgB [Oscillospiraceae bacterium]